MLYQETQSYRKFIWFMVVMPVHWVILITAWVAEKDPAEKQEILMALLIVLVIEGIIVALFLYMRLATRIDNESVSIRFIPFIKQRQFKWADIQSAYVRKYKPIAEYGGWGLRANWKRDSKAYNVWGDKGLQLELKDGKKVLIGTQQHLKLVEFLREFKKMHPELPVEEPQLG